MAEGRGRDLRHKTEKSTRKGRMYRKEERRNEGGRKGGRQKEKAEHTM